MHRLEPFAMRHQPTWVGIAIAVVGPLLGLLVRPAIGDAFVGYPYLTFFPAVLVAAWIGQARGGAVATVLSAIFAEYYLVEPFGYLLPTNSSDWIGLAFFIVVCALITALVHGFNRAVHQAATSFAALQSLNAGLERRVEERTRELAKANEQLQAEITAREAAEARIRQAQKMEALGQLTGGISHDFNNMLAIIIGSLDVATRRLARGAVAEGLASLDNALEGARRGATLTARLLAFSRQQPLMPAVTDINALVRGMEDLFRRTLGERIALEFVLSGGLWRRTPTP